jgi:hypothetical protein
MYPIRVERLLETPYLLYFILSTPFVRLMVDESMRVAMPKVNRETLKACHVVVPDHAERLEIVAFLSRESRTIDAMIAKIVEAIERLREYRIPRGRRLHQPFEVGQQRGVLVDGPLAASARAPHPTRGHPDPGAEFAEPPGDGRRGDPRGACHQRNAAPPDGACLGRGPHPTRPLGQRRGQRAVFRPASPQIHSCDFTRYLLRSSHLLSDES